MSKRRTFEQQSQSIEEQIAQLRERQRQVLARESEANRKGESATAFAIGRLMLECLPGGWRTVDLGRLESLVERSREAIARCAGEERPVEEASRRTRDWQRERRGRVIRNTTVGVAGKGGAER